MSEFTLPAKERKQEVVQSMFTSAANAYDLNNSVLSLGQHHRWKRLTIGLLDILPGHVVVDLCGERPTSPCLRPKRQPGQGLS
jgi:Methylase involved in ubiquinone/menaquinone biosynthesis